MAHTVIINRDGSLEAIWSDDLACLRKIGTATITRASHVEPTAAGLWEADMGPSGGPVLGPFELRQQAIDAEIAWLKEHRGL